MNNHNKNMDMLKAIGIITVIMGHTGSSFSGYIYTFHMGLFFLDYRLSVFWKKYEKRKVYDTIENTFNSDSVYCFWDNQYGCI